METVGWDKTCSELLQTAVRHWKCLREELGSFRQWGSRCDGGSIYWLTRPSCSFMNVLRPVTARIILRPVTAQNQIGTLWPVATQHLVARRQSAFAPGKPGMNMWQKLDRGVYLSAASAARQTCTVMPTDPLATRPPTLRLANAQIEPVCPASGRPLPNSHTRTVMSPDPLATSPAPATPPVQRCHGGRTCGELVLELVPPPMVLRAGLHSTAVL